ncbi:ATP-binding protein [Prevotella copri]|uniref:two-component regulator propeller domain-containing protein n=1 Tax=Segatella copri TaxID=165179 RepID=UPI00222F6229|nr:hybrid sensor histidine kinase/response regulator transcription factor [Segatella copri]MCW4118295.1 ATP-binding protein [Segatella copri]
MKKLLLFLGLILQVLALTASTSSIFKNLGLKEGLSNGFVNDMIIDGQGFIWAATESGLTRIAGTKCTIFKNNNSNIDNDGIMGLYYNKESNSIWILFKNGHIDVFDCKTQQFIHFTQKIPKKSVADIKGAADGGIWIAYYDGTIQHYTPKNQKFSTISNKRLPNIKNGIRSITDDGNDHLYIGLRIEGLYVYNLRTQKTKYFRHNPNDPQSLPGDNVRSICIDHAKNIWVGTNLGLGLLDPFTGKFKVFKHIANNPASLAGDNIHQIIEMNDRTLWIASDIGGISVLDLNLYKNPLTEELKFSQITKENSGLSSNNNRRIIQDSFGNIWIANYSMGIDFIAKSAASINTLQYMGKALEEVTGLYCDHQGNLWIGRDNLMSLYQNGKLMQTWNFSSYLSNSSSSIYVFEEDKKGNIWCGTSDNGVLKFNPHTHSFTRINYAQNLDVHALCENAQGKMWVGTEAGIFSVENDKINKEQELNRQMGNNLTIIYSIKEDNYGQIWIGTLDRGVFVFSKQMKLIVHLTEKNLLATNSINHIIKDADGGIWMATMRGLAYVQNPLQPGAIKNYDERYGIKDSHIRAISQDKQGNIWVSMFSGIACLNIHKQRFYNYDYESGIPTSNFVEASAVTTPDGTIYFGSPGGICFFNPQQLTEPKAVSPIQIINCERVGKLSDQFASRLISPNNEGIICLSHDDNTFKINFTIKDFSQEGNVEYSYMMKGLDDQWYETEGDNEVTFRNLKPGDYTFIIRAKLKNQDWEDASTAEMKVVVNPPLWLTWWAKLCYVLLIMGILGYFFRSYQKQLLLRNSLVQEKWESKQRQQVNEERLRFFTNITHELRTPLTLILGPLEDLMEDKEIAERVHHKIGCIHASAERLLNLINDILEFRKTQTQNRKLTVAKANLGALVREIGVRFKDLNQNSRLNILLNIQTGVPELYFDSEVINTVINNLMSNAIKYTPEGSITLSLTMPEDNTVAIAVEDTGYGIDKDALPHICDRYYQENGNHQASGTGIGLALVKSLATLHQAELTVESEKGRGSKFTFSLKADRTYPEALHKDDNQDLATAENAEENETTSKEPTEDIRPLLLIVEDNADIRLYIEESLHEDYRIIQACNGREGMEQAFSKVPDIIVSDIMMPEMDGIKMTHILKEDIRTSHIPIILLTAKTSINDQEEGYDSGADSYLTKPFSAKLLHSRIRNILSGRRRLADYIVQKNISQFETSADEQQTSQKATEEKEDAMTCQISNLDKKFLEKLNKLIENHISTDDLDMAFMTDKMAMSHSTFYRKVKALTGMSANEYIKKAKLRHSMTLLKKGEYSIAEVAILAGFNNLGNFRESFKREFGKSPSEILKGK